jgi:DNA-binding response OmpR family regulator
MKSRIAVVEDDAAIRDILQIILENEEYTVLMYENGELFLNDIPVDTSLFLIDKQLPGVDGLEIIKYLRAFDQTNNVPIILITALPAIRHRALKAGVDAVIEKPFSRIELLSIIHTLIKKNDLLSRQ